MADSNALSGIGSHLQVDHVYPQQLELDEGSSRPMSLISGLYSEKLFSRSPSRGLASSASKTRTSATTTARKEHDPEVDGEGTVSPLLRTTEEELRGSPGTRSLGRPVASQHSSLAAILAELGENHPSIAMARFQGENHRHERLAVGSLPVSPRLEGNQEGASSLSISLSRTSVRSPGKSGGVSPLGEMYSQQRTRKRTWESEDESNVSVGDKEDGNEVAMQGQTVYSDFIAVDQSAEGGASDLCATDLVFRLTRQQLDPTGLRPRVQRPGKWRKRPKKVEEDKTL